MEASSLLRLGNARFNYLGLALERKIFHCISKRSAFFSNFLDSKLYFVPLFPSHQLLAVHLCYAWTTHTTFFVLVVLTRQVLCVCDFKTSHIF